ncbi:MAG TPA: hypothetical protein GXZ56_11140 [Bacteroidales bacterium]|jgi:hypothetical protein|nr:hypothetical protein [Bacteroidales bacterium]
MEKKDKVNVPSTGKQGGESKWVKILKGVVAIATVIATIGPTITGGPKNNN